MTDIPMPNLSDSMERGTIIRWLIEEGEPVAKGDELVEIETDKAAVAHPSPADGFLHILQSEGAVCEVGIPIAQLLEERHVPNAVSVAGVSVPENVTVGSTFYGTPAPSAPVVPTATSGQPAVPSTPLAKRAAKLHGVDLQTVVGTGPRGRTTVRDVLQAAGVPTGSAPVRPAAVASTLRPIVAAQHKPSGGRGKSGDSMQPLTNIQRIIATRMSEANTIPTFQLHKDVAIDNTRELRAKMKELPGERRVPSINDFIIKACGLALANHPVVNGSFIEQGFELHSSVNVGFAVAAEGTLLVPTIFDANTKSLGTIAEETRALSRNARSASITPAQLSGGTFTVSNLGMYGMTAITPIINLPQAAILGVGAARETVTLVEGEITSRSIVSLTLSCDHRILYGADAALFFSEVSELLEAPLSLIL